MSETEKELLCPVCQDLFTPPRNPKVLPDCQHVVCEICLPDVVGRFRNCPECRTVISVPIEAIRTNVKLRNLAEITHRQKEKALKSRLVRDNMRKKWERIEPRRCDHTTEAAFYCCTCEEPICPKCLEHGHQLHDYQTPDTMEIEIASMVKEMEKERKSLDAKLEERTKQKEGVDNLCKCEERLIEQCVEEHIEECRRRGAELKNELVNQMQTSVNVLLQDLSEIKEVRGRTNEIYEKATQRSEVLGERDAARPDDAMDKSEQIKQKASLKKNIQHQLVTLQQRNKSSTVRNTSHISVPHFVGMPAIQPDLGSYVKTHVRKLQVIDDSFLDACSVASSKYTLAICDRKQHRFVVFCRKHGVFQKVMSIQLVHSNKEPPQDIAVLEDGSFLVARNVCIEVYSSSGQYRDSVTTNTGRANETTRIRSVAAIESKPNCFYAGDVMRHEITEHNSKRQCVRVIKISSEIRPIHMTVITASQIVITDSRKAKVEILDVRTPNTKTLLTVDVQEARGVSYDYKSQCLLVARSKRTKRNVPEAVLKNTGEIVQYCAVTGRFVKCLTEGLYFPGAQVITESGILVVTNMNEVVTYELLHKEEWC